MKKLTIFALTALFTITSAMPQSTNAGITGIVCDTNGESLPGSTMLVRNDANGFSMGTDTAISRSCSIRQLPLRDKYSVTVSFAGFVAQSLSGFSLNHGDVLMLDFELED